MHGDVGALARIAAGGFEITAQPDAAQALPLARLGAAALEARPVAERHGAIHHHAIGAVVVGDALRVLVGKRRRRNEIALAQRDAIETVLLRGFVDQPLDDVDHFRPAGAAIRRGAHGGREDGTRADVRDGNAIARRRQSDALHQRHVRAAVRADIAEIVGAQRQEAAVGVERELGGHRQIAAHIVADEGFVCARRSISPAGRPCASPRPPARIRERSCCGCRNCRRSRGRRRAPIRTARSRSPRSPSSGARCRRSRHRACSARSPDRRRRPRRAAPSARR